MDKVTQIINNIESIKNKGDYEKAIIETQKGIELYNDYRLYEEMADIYLYLGKNIKAEKAVDFALDLKEKSPTGNYLKGFILLGKGLPIKAILYLERSNKIMPNNAEVLRNLGWAYHTTGMNEKGVSILKRALILSPDDNLIIEDLAMALIGNGKLEDGNKLLESIGKSGFIV